MSTASTYVVYGLMIAISVLNVFLLVHVRRVNNEKVSGNPKQYFYQVRRRGLSEATAIHRLLTRFARHSNQCTFCLSHLCLSAFTAPSSPALTSHASVSSTFGATTCCSADSLRSSGNGAGCCRLVLPSR